MKWEYLRPTTVEVTTVRVRVPVNYGDEDMPYDFPGRKGDIWTVDIDIDTGKIQDWKGPAFDLYMKVVDGGSYYLFDEDRAWAQTLENEYVPHGLIPGEYGDYIHFDISEDGFIKHWPKEPDLSKFFEKDD